MVADRATRPALRAPGLVDCVSGHRTYLRGYSHCDLGEVLPRRVLERACHAEGRASTDSFGAVRICTASDLHGNAGGMFRYSGGGGRVARHLGCRAAVCRALAQSDARGTHAEPGIWGPVHDLPAEHRLSSAPV